MTDQEMIELSFTINGTDTNPYARWSLKQNPFPSTPYKEFNLVSLRLNSLGGEPIRSAEDIRERLAGFDPAFVDRVVAAWKPGKIVRIKITFPRGRTS